MHPEPNAAAQTASPYALRRTMPLLAYGLLCLVAKPASTHIQVIRAIRRRLPATAA